MTSTPPHIRRLRHELSSLTSIPLPACLLHLGPVSDEDIQHWTAVIRGSPSTAYERGAWLLDIRVPESYPMKSPEVKFVTRCCHPNIHWQVRKSTLKFFL